MNIVADMNRYNTKLSRVTWVLTGGSFFQHVKSVNKDKNVIVVKRMELLWIFSISIEENGPHCDYWK